MLTPRVEEPNRGAILLLRSPPMRPSVGPGVGGIGVQSSLDSLSTGGRTLLALARHDARRAYAGTWAGWAWALLTPLVPFLVLAVIFSVGLRLPLGGAPYVYGFAAAYVPWTLLAGPITAAAGSIVELRFLVKRARFPVALIPSAPSLTHTIPHVVL